MTHEIERHNGLQLNTVADLKQISQMLSASGFFSDSREAAQAFVKVLAGQEMRFGPFASMTGIHIIQGKPTIGANLMAAAIKRHPRYNYRVVKHTDEVCEIDFYERFDGGKLEKSGTSTFTREDAKRAGTKNLDKFPKNMLFARAISNGVRFYAPDVFDGTGVYTPDELGASVDDDGDVIDTTSREVSVEQAAPKAPPPISKEKAAGLQKALGAMGITEHNEFASRIAERRVESFTELNTKEAAAIYAAAKELQEAAPETDGDVELPE